MADDVWPKKNATCPRQCEHAAPFPPFARRGEQIGKTRRNRPGHVVLVDATAKEALMGGAVGNARDKMILVHVFDFGQSAEASWDAAHELIVM